MKIFSAIRIYCLVLGLALHPGRLSGADTAASAPAMVDEAEAALDAIPPAALEVEYASLPLLPASEVKALRGTTNFPLVRVRGVVTGLSPTGTAIFLRDKSSCLYADGVFPFRPSVGDQMELVGRPVLNATTPELRVARAWRLGHGPLPKPNATTIAELIGQRRDAHFVEIEGKVVGSLPSPQQSIWVLEQQGATILVNNATRNPVTPAIGSTVRLRGICSLGKDHEGRVVAARFFLRFPEDLTLLAGPSFWNKRRVVALLLLLTAAGCAAAAGYLLLRRQVAAQTLELRERYERVAALEELRGAVFSSLAEGVVVVDSTGRIVECNPAAEKILGVPRADILGKNVRTDAGEVVHPDGRPFSPEELPVNATLKDGQPRIGVMMGLQRGKDRERYWISASSRPLLKPGSPVPVGAVSSFEDVTGRVQAEEQRRKLESQLQQGQKMKARGTLAGGVAHDFNNLLGVIVGNAGLARAELPEGHPAGTYLDEILRAGGRAAEVVRQILSFSRKRDSQHGVIDVRPVVAEAVRQLRSTIPPEIVIVSRLEEAALPARCAAGEIHQVVMNLGMNAWQALEGRGGSIEVELAGVADVTGLQPVAGRLEKGRHLRLAVRDSGCGLDAATAERIFEPFFTTKPAGQGTGLGLAVVHGIIESNGGAICLETSPGQGACFQIFLPASETAPAHASQSPDLLTVAGGGGEPVLVVDDEPAVARTTQLMLRRLGYAAECVTSPEEAIIALRTRPGHFRVLLTDLTMPVMTGCQLAVEARHLQPELTVVLMTGYGTDLKPTHLREAGIAEMLLKPFQAEALGQTVYRVLSVRHR